ncbi:MAG: gamma-glutamylcyclotransferase [Deferrisomatales bacterium]
MTDWVFVYGTLKRGGRYHRRIRPFVREGRTGWVPGRLLDLGGYPGWVAGAGRVWGEAYRLSPLAPALAVLDELEDYYGPGDPRNLYERLTVEVRGEGEPVRAWAYRYVGPRQGRPFVAGGRWPPGRSAS